MKGLLSTFDVTQTAKRTRENIADKAKDMKDSGDSTTNSLISELGRDLSMEYLACCPGFKSVIFGGEELYKLRRQLGIVEHWVYFSCNRAEWEAFDTVGYKFRSLPPILASECFKCCDMESLAVATKLLVFGREVQSLSVYKYSVVTDSWVYVVTPNTPRCLFASGNHNEIAIVAGGCDSKGKILGSAEMYKSNTGMWQPLPSLNTPRKLCSGVDGEVGNPKVLTSGEVFDMKTNVWVEILNMLPGHIVEGVDENALAATRSPLLLAVVKNALYAAYHEEMLLKKYNKSLNI
ncbi:OLC1v1012546C1 [Oldenlandia corymbosa var. corymbosa]|uniref:OLC1v1012546C1 n=1 Tax=Oldenlandia corymbosa var. corymbosa TaxID=529605 RepID=A0AAV1DZE2_OLDCO|nr:OLC1v1012546C1 [Oldenlandia corymbosa var. corymbosa]